MGKPVFYIGGAIGEGQNTAEAVGRFTRENPGPVLLEVNSFGGVASEGAAIMALLQTHGQVTVHVMGVALSAASLLVMGASDIAVHSAAMMMLHDPENLVFGDAEALREEADILDRIAETYAEAYSTATGHPLARIRSWMRAETWMTAEEAVALHFADRLLEAPVRGKPVAAFDYTKFRAAPAKLLKMTARQGWAMPAPIEGAA